jgi:hypothetical protein
VILTARHQTPQVHQSGVLGVECSSFLINIHLESTLNTSNESQKEELVEALLDEVSDIVLICYLAYSCGEKGLRDLFEALKDGEALSIEDLRYNLEIVRQKKGEAYRDPMRPVFERLMRLDGGQGFAIDALQVKPASEAQDTVH